MWTNFEPLFRTKYFFQFQGFFVPYYVTGCRQNACYIVVGSGWLLSCPGGPWMVVDPSWWALDGSDHFVVGSGWLLLFPGGL